MYFVAHIHNNNIGVCTEVSSIEEGHQVIAELVKAHYNRAITGGEWDAIVGDNQFDTTEDGDDDNLNTWQICSLE